MTQSQSQGKTRAATQLEQQADAAVMTSAVQVARRTSRLVALWTLIAVVAKVNSLVIPFITIWNADEWATDKWRLTSFVVSFLISNETAKFAASQARSKLAVANFLNAKIAAAGAAGRQETR